MKPKKINVKTLNIEHRKCRVSIRTGTEVLQFKIPGKLLIPHIEKWATKYLYQRVPLKKADKVDIKMGLPDVGIPAKVNERVKYYREQKGLTQVQLAGAAKITQANLSSIEKGDRKIGVVVAKKLASALGVDYRHLL